MNLACQKCVGNLQKVLGIEVTPLPFWEKFPKNTVFFLNPPLKFNWNKYLEATKWETRQENLIFNGPYQGNTHSALPIRHYNDRIVHCFRGSRDLFWLQWPRLSGSIARLQDYALSVLCVDCWQLSLSILICVLYVFWAIFCYHTEWWMSSIKRFVINLLELSQCSQCGDHSSPKHWLIFYLNFQQQHD